MIKAIDVASTMIGLSESTGRNDGLPAEMFMDGDKLPWCAGFVLYCFKESSDGKISGNRWKMRNVKNLYNHLIDEGFSVGRNVKPMRNDIVFFNSRGDSDAGRGWHVGIVSYVYDNMIDTVEGNVGNAVKNNSHSRSSTSILGYARLN